MKHHAAHITWRCVNRCGECWVRQTVYTRPDALHVKERTATDWLRAIDREKPDMVDVLGGEPFVVDWLYDLLAGASCHLALSTNGVLTERICDLAGRERVRHLRSITCSYHPDAANVHRRYEWRWRRSVTALKAAGYAVCCNLVDYPGYRERAAETLAWLKETGVPVLVSPYEHTDTLGQKRATGLVCRGGEDHLLIAPDGSAYPCFTAFRSPYWRDYCLGNWLDGTMDAGRKPIPCYLDCVDYYVLPHEHSAGDMWGSRPTPAEEGE